MIHCDNCSVINIGDKCEKHAAMLSCVTVGHHKQPRLLETSELFTPSYCVDLWFPGAN